ncbi:phage baseplate assembly protein V [Thiohalocapsa sp. ML1]|jgi:hypothetical protein|uniref:phage baseplate assembly protein V n=1 Tax=Thiohalocapsa sp. ML1 TaxID=1431688 RepID=UPI0007320341|nr:phage baseplate assembly protein V [Thiohalocapsa sp. ML1]
MSSAPFPFRAAPAPVAGTDAAAAADTLPAAPTAQQAPGDLLALLRALIRHELDARPGSALAVVDAVRHKAGDDGPANYDCSLHLHGRPDARFRHVPICTGHRGSVATPRAGDVVLLQFVGGDPQRPVIVGRLYDDQLRAPDFGPEALCCLLPPDAPPAERIDLRASAADGRRLEVLLADDVRVVVADGRIELSHGARRVLLDAEDGSTRLAAGGASVRLGDDGNLTIAADGDLTLEAGGNVTLKAGANLDLGAGGNAKLTGAKVDIN